MRRDQPGDANASSSGARFGDRMKTESSSSRRESGVAASLGPAHVAFMVALFLIAFLPRAIEPVSRPLVWYLRSAYFIEDVLSGNWAGTVYSEHPGVTLMWPAGIGLKVYWTLSGIQPAAHTLPPDFEPIHFFGPVPRAEIAAALVPPALLIALGIVLAYLMLRRLFDNGTAVVAALLLALSPYYLAQSKILHLDASMATLMLLSALALLIYRRQVRRRWLLLSGGLGGLALLTKVPSIFLVPFCGLVLLMDLVREAGLQPGSRDRFLRGVVPRLILPLSLWVLAAGLVYVALWPVMWVDPGKGLAAVRWGITRHVSTAHDSTTLFLGRVMREDPGPLFYIVSLLFRTSEVTFTFLVAGALGATVFLVRSLFTSKRPPDRLRQESLDLLLLLAYAVAYLAQMSLGAKKMPRYVLPSLLALNILAASGVVAWARVMARYRPRAKLALMALPVLVQAALTLPRHPYYGTALNWLAGGPPAAARAILIGEEGEGYDELTAYLNARSDVEQLTVAAQLKHVFNQTFRGTTLEIDQDGMTAPKPADYVAFHRNYIARNYKVDEWGRVWERYAARTPEREVAFDGVPYAWLYRKMGPEPIPEQTARAQVGGQFEFSGYDLRETGAAPGDEIPIALYWRATEPVTQDLSIFLHLVDGSGRLVWQDDGAANHGERPTWSWGPGETIVDPHTVKLPADLAEGDYLLTTGLYDWTSGERLSIRDSAGARLPDDRFAVTTFNVTHPRPDSTAQWARALSLLVVVPALVRELMSDRSQ